MADYERLRELVGRLQEPYTQDQSRRAAEEFKAAEAITTLLAEMDALKAERAEMVAVCETLVGSYMEDRGAYALSELCNATETARALLSRIQTPPEVPGPVPAAGSNSGGSTAEDDGS
jgi:hypothetical protein